MFSCEENNQKGNNYSQYSKNGEVKKVFNDSEKDSVFLSNSIDINFSDLNSLDRFSIKIIGKSILDGKLHFTIEDTAGDTLLNEVYPSRYLIGYGLDKETTEDAEIEYITKRVNEFFSEDNFSTPAINEKDKFYSDYSKESIWNDIKSDTTSTGFYYLIGEDRGCHISYSKKQRKVVIYFCCC